MPDYLLPCTCGKKTTVSTAQAGDTVRCACGAELHVPTMRAMRELESADTATPGARRSRGGWEDRHRGAFLLVLASLGCLAVAAYLWATLPQLVVDLYEVNPQGIATAFDKATPAESLEYFAEMEHGDLGSAFDANEKPRRMMLWGIGIAVVLAIVAQGGAMLLVMRPKQGTKNQSKPTS